MSNELLNPVTILKESMIRLENNITFIKQVNREFDDKFAVPDAKTGYTVNARLPVRFRGRIGDAMQPEDIREQMIPITVNRLYGQDLLISDQDLTLTIDRFGERYVEPATEIIANMADGEGCDQWVNVYNCVGTPGTVPTTLDTYASAGVALDDMAVPPSPGMRALVVTSRAQAKALGFQNNLFNPPKEVSEQYRTGKMGIAVGWKWNMDQNIGRQTVGYTNTANPIVTSVSADGTNVVTSGWAASQTVLKAGDIVAFGGSNAVNPISFRDTGALRTFVVTQDIASDVSGNATIYISPSINTDTTSPFQTVTASPLANAAVYVYGIGTGTALNNISQVSSAQMLGFHRDAFTFVCVPLELPGGLDWSERVTHPRLGVSMRLTRGFDIKENRRYTRLDLLGGWKTTRPEMAVRIAAN